MLRRAASTVEKTIHEGLIHRLEDHPGGLRPGEASSLSGIVREEHHPNGHDKGQSLEEYRPAGQNAKEPSSNGRLIHGDHHRYLAYHSEGVSRGWRMIQWEHRLN